MATRSSERIDAFIVGWLTRFTAVRLPADIEGQLEMCLRELGPLVDADRCVLLGGSPDTGLSWITCADGMKDGRLSSPNVAEAFPWHFAQLCGRDEPLSVDALSHLPGEAHVDRASAEALGIRSMLMVPVRDEEAGAHCLWLQSLHRERHWPPDLARRLQPLARAFANALARRRLDETREVEARHADLLEAVGAILWRADVRTFQTTFVSKEAETILGFPLESWLKIPGFWRDHLHPDDREWVQAFTTRAVAEHRRHDFEYRMIVADGRTVWLRNIVKVLVEDGEAAELIGVTVDVTPRKQAEFETARMRHELAHASRVASLGELAATLAHELNQPLGAIVSNAESGLLFLERQPPPLDHLHAALDDIRRDGQRAGAIIHRVRRLLQKQVLETGPIDVGRLAGEVVGLVRPLALARQISLRVDAPDDLPAAHADPVHLQQVVLNLLLNAIEAVGQCPPPGRHVLLRIARRGREVEVAVVDSGPGIPPERLTHLFEPFVTTKPAGLGMGLPICRTIVEAHGGTISVENNASGGATVRFSLPVHGQTVEGT